MGVLSGDPEILDNDDLSDEDVPAETHRNLLQAISQLYKKQRIDAPKRREAAEEISEFNLTSSDKSGKVKIATLLTDLKRKVTHKEIEKKVKEARTKAKPLPPPLEKLKSDKIKRSVGYDQVRSKLNKWDKIVEKNRMADQLVFPLPQKRLKKEPVNFLTTFDKPSELEQAMAEVLQESVVAQDERELENELSKLSVDEMIERRRTLAKMKARESYRIAKAARQNRIKSKKYHRRLKKEKIKKQLEEFEKLKETDPEKALEKLEELERARAEERISLRHRNTGKWAQNQAIRAKYDKEARAALSEQLAQSRELTRKLRANNSDSDSEGALEEMSSEDEDDPTLPQANRSGPPGDTGNPWLNEYNNFLKGFNEFSKKKDVNESETSEDDVDDTIPERQISVNKLPLDHVTESDIKSLGNEAKSEISNDISASQFESSKERSMSEDVLSLDDDINSKEYSSQVHDKTTSSESTETSETRAKSLADASTNEIITSKSEMQMNGDAPASGNDVLESVEISSPLEKSVLSPSKLSQEDTSFPKITNNDALTQISNHTTIIKSPEKKNITFEKHSVEEDLLLSQDSNRGTLSKKDNSPIKITKNGTLAQRSNNTIETKSPGKNNVAPDNQSIKENVSLPQDSISNSPSKVPQKDDSSRTPIKNEVITQISNCNTVSKSPSKKNETSEEQSKEENVSFPQNSNSPKVPKEVNSSRTPIKNKVLTKISNDTTVTKSPSKKNDPSEKQSIGEKVSLPENLSESKSLSRSKSNQSCSIDPQITSPKIIVSDSPSQDVSLRKKCTPKKKVLKRTTENSVQLKNLNPSLATPDISKKQASNNLSLSDNKQVSDSSKSEEQIDSIEASPRNKLTLSTPEVIKIVEKSVENSESAETSPVCEGEQSPAKIPTNSGCWEVLDPLITNEKKVLIHKKSVKKLKKKSNHILDIDSDVEEPPKKVIKKKLNSYLSKTISTSENGGSNARIMRDIDVESHETKQKKPDKSLRDLFDDAAEAVQNYTLKTSEKMKSLKAKTSNKRGVTSYEKQKPSKPTFNNKKPHIRGLDEALIELNEDDGLSTSVTRVKQIQDLQLSQDNEDEKEEEEPSIDPKKHIVVKPQKLLSEVGEVVEGGSESEDDEEGSQKRHLMEAFADDDISAQFHKEKREESQKNEGQTIDLSLPGWGSWGGSNIAQKKRRKGKLVVKLPRVPRKDAKKRKVIINEDPVPALRAKLVSDLPYPYSSVKEYEASIRAPIGKTWVPERAFKKLIAPPVRTKMGAIIEPISRDIDFNPKKIHLRRKLILK